MLKTRSLCQPVLLFVAFTGLIAHWSGGLHADARAESQADLPELQVAIALDMPPYVMKQATSGLEVDIIRRALMNYSVRFVQIPYKQLQTAVQKKRADVSVGVQFDHSRVFYSDDFVTFANVAISKKADAVEVNGVDDLKDHRVLTWQSAYRELGVEFEQLFSPESPQRSNYEEFADQNEQVKTFWQAKDAIIVIDRNIFSHFTKTMGRSMSDVTVHHIFPDVTNFKVSFRDAAVRDDFNQRLAELCQSGEYATLLDRYDVKLQHSVCDEQAVELAASQFYVALNALFTGDVKPMTEVWSHANNVTYMGPVGGFQVGWNQVRANWEAQAALKLGGEVHSERMRITVGQDIAVIHNFEVGENMNTAGKIRKVSIRATSVFRKEQGRWKMIGHHTDLLPFLKK